MNNIQQLSHESANELSAIRMHSPELQANVRSTYYNSCITKFLRTHFYSQVQELSLILIMKNDKIVHKILYRKL